MERFENWHLPQRPVPSYIKLNHYRAFVKLFLEELFCAFLLFFLYLSNRSALFLTWLM